MSQKTAISILKTCLRSWENFLICWHRNNMKTISLRQHKIIFLYLPSNCESWILCDSYKNNQLYKTAVHNISQKVVVETLTLLLSILEISCPNLDPGEVILTEVFRDFPQSLQYFKLGHNHFFPNPFQFIICVPPFHSMLYILSKWKETLN
jgi:hypothetical protein